MKKIRTWIKRLLLALFTVAFLLAIAIAYLGSKQTLSPKRRVLADYHLTTLNHPGNFGLRITKFSPSDGTPCLVCEPQATGPAAKSQLLRQELTKRHVSLAPWGTIRGTIIMLHGHRGRKEDHLPICERFCAAGFRCICIDLPGHGDHPLPFATFGKQEIPLIERLWQEYSKQDPDAQAGPLFLFGYSQGGAITLQAASSPILQAKAIASVSAFSSLDKPIAASAKHLPVIVRDLTPLTTRACAFGIYCRAGIFPSDVSPCHAAEKITIPTFLCHGLEDSFVPPDQAQLIYNAIPHTHKVLSLIPNAQHHNTLSTGSTALYADICEHFLKNL